MKDIKEFISEAKTINVTLDWHSVKEATPKDDEEVYVYAKKISYGDSDITDVIGKYILDPYQYGSTGTQKPKNWDKVRDKMFQNEMAVLVWTHWAYPSFKIKYNYPTN